MHNPITPLCASSNKPYFFTISFDNCQNLPFWLGLVWFLGTQSASIVDQNYDYCSNQESPPCHKQEKIQCWRRTCRGGGENGRKTAYMAVLSSRSLVLFAWSFRPLWSSCRQSHYSVVLSFVPSCGCIMCFDLVVPSFGHVLSSSSCQRSSSVVVSFRHAKY